MTWVLCLDSLRHIDETARTVTRFDGIDLPTAREGTGPMPFRAIAPDPPVPGIGLTIVWTIHELGRVRMTSTSCVIGVWEGLIPPDPSWASKGTRVNHRGVPRLEAPTPHAAFGLAAVLASRPTAASTSSAPNVPKFRALHNRLLAGSDLIATCTTACDAIEVAAVLAQHPSAAVLAPGLAVAADEHIDGFRLMPDWLIEHNDLPWVERVATAARNVGVRLQVEGDERSWAATGTYRALDFRAAVDGPRCHVSITGQCTSLETEELGGPLSVVWHIMRAIDSLGENVLLQYALQRHGTA